MMIRDTRKDDKNIINGIRTGRENHRRIND